MLHHQLITSICFSITEVEEEYQAFAAYQMVYERFYTDTEEATTKFRAFQQTMRECKGLTQRAKTPIASLSRHTIALHMGGALGA